MRKLFVLILACSATLLYGQQTNKTPILRGFLQSDFDGAGKKATNYSEIRATNFVDAATGSAIVSGGAATNGVVGIVDLRGQTNRGIVNITNNDNLIGGTFTSAAASNILGALLSPRDLYVNKTGSNNWPGTLLLPRNTISNTLSSATSGDTIHVAAGTWNEFNLLKNGVNIEGSLGADLIWASPRTNDPIWGIFDDRPSGAVTNRIIWPGLISFHPTTNFILDFGQWAPGNVVGAGVFTNPATRVNIKCGRVGIAGWGTDAAAFAIHNCSYIDLECDEIFINVPGDVTVYDAGFDDLASITETSIGVWWQLGDATVRVKRIKVSNQSCWWNEPAGLHTNELWFEGDFVDRKFYINSHSTNYISWNRLKNMVLGDSPAIDFFGNGKHYFTVDGKIESDGQPPINLAGGIGDTNIPSGGRLWVTTQKLTTGSYPWVGFTDASATNFSVHLTVQEFEGGPQFSTNGFRLTGTSRVYCDYGLTGATNIAAAASSIIVRTPVPMPATNYTPIVIPQFTGVPQFYVTNITRTNFTVVFSAGVTNGGRLDWAARLWNPITP